jgi:hypothetical protein
MQGFPYCTDEKIFGLGAELNLHNMVEWSNTNPDYTVPKGNHYAGVMTICGVTPKGVIGPFFPQTNIDAGACQNLLAKEFLPAPHKRVTSRNTWFQQDSAPAHTAETTVNFLNQRLNTH